MARARSNDPATSHAAACEIERSGRANAQRSACLAEVQKNPGKTAAEIAAAIGLERHAPSRRLPELRGAGKIKNGDARACGVTGRMSITWLPVQEAQA